MFNNKAFNVLNRKARQNKEQRFNSHQLQKKTYEKDAQEEIQHQHYYFVRQGYVFIWESTVPTSHI